MFELVLVVCLLTNPDECRVERLPFQAPLSIMECMRRGQLELPRWLDEHPNWTVKSWRCDMPKA